LKFEVDARFVMRRLRYMTTERFGVAIRHHSER
jgi:hypothetical protein